MIEITSDPTADLAALLAKSPARQSPSSTRIAWLLKLSAALDAADLGDLAESARNAATALISDTIELVRDL